MVFETVITPIQTYVPVSYVQKSLRHRLIWPQIPRLTNTFIWNCNPYKKEESQSFQYSQLIKLYYSDDVTSELPNVTPPTIASNSTAPVSSIPENALLTDDVKGEVGPLGVCVWPESNPADRRIYGTPWTTDIPLHGGEYSRVGQGTCIWGFDEPTRKITAPPGYKASFYVVPDPSPTYSQSFSDEDIVIAGRCNPVPLPAVDRLTFGHRLILHLQEGSAIANYSDEIFTNDTLQISDPYSGGRFHIQNMRSAVGLMFGASLTKEWRDGNVLGWRSYTETDTIPSEYLESPGALFFLDKTNSEFSPSVAEAINNRPWSENIIPLFPVKQAGGIELMPCTCESEGNREFSLHPDGLFKYYYTQKVIGEYTPDFTDKTRIVQLPPLTAGPGSYPCDAARTEELFRPALPELTLPAETAWHREYEYHWSAEAKANGVIGVLCYLGGSPEDDSCWIYKTIDELLNDTYNGSIGCRSFWFIWRELQVNTGFQILAPARLLL